ncbi:MAG TPA: zf-HC2 domain-containing protein [Thermoanaerobaculia bacterium]|jgi:hypothetical protein
MEAILSPKGCPSAEDLAAYIDGVLDKAASRRFTEHLASCEDCYAVYTETLLFQLESSPADPEVDDGDVLPFRSPAPAPSIRDRVRRATRWLPLAALLLVGVGSGTYFTYFELLALPKLATIPATPPIASLPPAEPGASPLWLGPTHRGVDKEELGIDEASFRMGVQTVNLQATLQAGQVRESEDIIARILQILDTQPLTKPLYDRYAGITFALEKKRPPAELLPEADRLARGRESRDAFDPTFLDLGLWVEAGRLSAMARKPSFFQKPENRAFLRRLRWNDKLGWKDDVKLDAATRASLDRISDIISKSDLRPSDYVELQHELEKILGTYYPMS